METDDGLYLRVDMPGVGKESVKVLVEKEGTLVMEGEGKKDFKDDEFGPRYTNSIQLPQTALLNTKAIKAEMVNGVLKLFVPKLKVEERTDVLLVSVD
ncbi:heat shock 22 kDa protein mitochondrial [Phtheirospermum japonicum]|uniref:Heat shock 22 kDa protein mitochondrial n=1 Tax=Phtheirospermum japonicum TaxID=374723 RepID=A0A830CME5_9LAMI|nr:heat shock 22 kDa protein mitochondrial [Phtheirospermum japonicum]